MNEETKKMYAQRIETGLFFLWGIVFLLFPLTIATFTTDSVILPKEILLGGAVLISLIGWGVQMMLHGQVRIRRTPLDVPVILFVVATLLSSIFSVNRADSLVAAFGILFVGLAYFVLVNVFRTQKVSLFFLSSFLTGSILTALITILARYKIYVLPFAATRVPSFSPMGSYVETAMYLFVALTLAVSFVVPLLKKSFSARTGVFTGAGVILLAGLIVVVSGLLTDQKPILLPFDTGFQTAFAAVSQDSGRVLQTFLFGEGYGTFASVFSRFHNASLNSNQQLWYISFSNSSSYILELLATTGFVGILSFLFLGVRALTPVAKKKNDPFYLPVLVLFVLSCVLPLSFVEVALLFLLLAGFTIAQREAVPHEYFDIELQLVALKKGVLAFMTLDTDKMNKADTHPTPILAFAILLALTIVLGYYATLYAVSDILFQSSLTAANKNNGTATYKLQTQAIATYPYRSDYYRIFSQTNIALANSLLSLEAGKSSPSATTQQTAYTLIQQSITTARQATTLAPQSTVAWQNLSSIYRTLIGVGQNAQEFAIASAQQAIALDSANPQEYLNLGGLYYQIGQYDNAIQIFQQAISLKSDYVNAYYNLGHAYEQKGDYTSALTQFQTVATLVASDKANAQKIAQEIADLQAKIGKAGSQQSAGTPTQANGAAQQPLNISGQQQTLPNTQGHQIPLVSPTPGK